MSDLPSVVIPFDIFVERRERRRRNAAVLQVCDRWEFDAKAVAARNRMENVVPPSTQAESSRDEETD